MRTCSLVWQGAHSEADLKKMHSCFLKGGDTIRQSMTRETIKTLCPKLRGAGVKFDFYCDVIAVGKKQGDRRYKKQD